MALLLGAGGLMPICVALPPPPALPHPATKVRIRSADKTGARYVDTLPVRQLSFSDASGNNSQSRTAARNARVWLHERSAGELVLETRLLFPFFWLIADWNQAAIRLPMVNLILFARHYLI